MMTRPLLLIALLPASWCAPARTALAAAPPLRPVWSAGDTIGDGTSAAEWTLDNGLRVTVRNVPGCRAVSVALGYGFGSDHDPDGREGMAALLGEVLLTSPAGDLPARARAQMPSIRPLGWDLKVTPRAVFLSEIATVEQFPGVLNETAIRLRGVRVTDAILRTAADEVRRSMAERYSINPAFVLHYGARLAASAKGLEAMSGYAETRALQNLTVAEVQDRLNALCVAPNAVLSIAGDVGAFDVGRLIENTFAGVPGGPPMARPGGAVLRPAVHMVSTSQITAPLAVIGIVAPALGDTSYPSFALHALAFGAACQVQWPKPERPLWARFQYSILDEPDLVRFFPPVNMGTTIEQMSEEFDIMLRAVTAEALRPEHLEDAREGMVWLVGGPLAGPERKRVRTDARFLDALAVVSASRAMIGPESVWEEFRDRLAAVRPEVDRWREYFRDPRHQVRLLAGPRSHGPADSDAPPGGDAR